MSVTLPTRAALAFLVATHSAAPILPLLGAATALINLVARLEELTGNAEDPVHRAEETPTAEDTAPVASEDVSASGESIA